MESGQADGRLRGSPRRAGVPGLRGLGGSIKMRVNMRISFEVGGLPWNGEPPGAQTEPPGPWGACLAVRSHRPLRPRSGTNGELSACLSSLSTLALSYARGREDRPRRPGNGRFGAAAATDGPAKAPRSKRTTVSPPRRAVGLLVQAVSGQVHQPPADGQLIRPAQGQRAAGDHADRPGGRVIGRRPQRDHHIVPRPEAAVPSRGDEPVVRQVGRDGLRQGLVECQHQPRRLGMEAEASQPRECAAVVSPDGGTAATLRVTVAGADVSRPSLTR